MEEKALVPIQVVELVKNSEVPSFLKKIRPAWQEKKLISRVKRLLNVDPSSACQRLLNAAIHDLREKIVIAGVDIAKEAANQYGLPPVEKDEDLESYPATKLIELAYRIGLLSRPEWRRVSRCYDIRRDLEHEDDEYEAGVEDCIYIFKTCIETILAKDPIQLIRVTDVKKLIEEAVPITPSISLMEDFEHAPQPRQEEIFRFLISIALDKNQADIIQQNAFTFLVRLASLMYSQVKLNLAKFFQKRISGKKLDSRHARVAYATGILPYLKRSQVEEFFQEILAKMTNIDWHWSAYQEHGELLRFFKEVGGFRFCPSKLCAKILKWLVLTYLGVPGGLTRYGHVRQVFYSNTAAPLIFELISEARDIISNDLHKLRKDKDVSQRCSNRFIAQRFEGLLDIIEQD